MYTEQSSHWWDISRYATRKHCKTSMYMYMHMKLPVGREAMHSNVATAHVSSENMSEFKQAR